MVECAGGAVAQLFLANAASNLPNPIFESLCDFIVKVPYLNAQHNRQQLRDTLSTSLNAFRDPEMQSTGEDDSTMVAPSSQPDASLGIIMHCQSKEGAVDGFWDTENQSIQMLAQKALNPGFIFGYDWHWRSEGRARDRRGDCPASKWSKDKRKLHDEFSQRLLDILPLPLVVVARSCAKTQYRTRLDRHSSYELTVLLRHQVHINFSLETRQAKLRRITAYVDHSSASFFQPDRAAKACTRLDAVLNFVLRLLKIPHQDSTFTNTQNSCSRGVPGSAPLSELSHYSAKEREHGKTLAFYEYSPSFLVWARQYLDRDIIGVLEEGESVASAIRFKINSRLSASFGDSERMRLHAIDNQKKNSKRYGFEIKEFWDGQQVKVNKRGVVRLYLPGTQPALQVYVPLSVRGAYTKDESAKPTIRFHPPGISLTLGMDVILEICCEKLLRMPKFGQAGIDHLHKELARKTS